MPFVDPFAVEKEEASGFVDPFAGAGDKANGFVDPFAGEEAPEPGRAAEFIGTLKERAGGALRSVGEAYSTGLQAQQDAQAAQAQGMVDAMQTVPGAVRSAGQAAGRALGVLPQESVQAFRDEVGYEAPEKPNAAGEYLREIGGKIERVGNRVLNPVVETLNRVMPEDQQIPLGETQRPLPEPETFSYRDPESGKPVQTDRLTREGLRQERFPEQVRQEQFAAQERAAAERLAEQMRENPLVKTAVNLGGGTMGKISQALVDATGGRDELPTLLHAVQEVNRLGLAQGDSFKNRFFTEVLPQVAVDSPLYLLMAGVTKGFGTFAGMNVLEQSLDKINDGREFDADRVKTALMTDMLFKVVGLPGKALGQRAAAKELAANPLRNVLWADRAALGTAARLKQEAGRIATRTGILTGSQMMEMLRVNQEIDPKDAALMAARSALLSTALSGPRLLQAVRTGRVESALMKAGMTRADAAVMAPRLKGMTLEQVREAGNMNRAFYGEAGNVNRVEYIWKNKIYPEWKAARTAAQHGAAKGYKNSSPDPKTTIQPESKPKPAEAAPPRPKTTAPDPGKVWLDQNGVRYDTVTRDGKTVVRAEDTTTGEVWYSEVQGTAPSPAKTPSPKLSQSSIPAPGKATPATPVPEGALPAREAPPEGALPAREQAVDTPRPAADALRPEGVQRFAQTEYITVPGGESVPARVMMMPVSSLQLSKDVPNFKADADPKTGVVDGQRLGRFRPELADPIYVWERTDGRMEVISGRHRLDSARRSGEQTILTRVLREADGFDKADAVTRDSELNILDGQGKVRDYATYFKGSDITEQEAVDRGLLSRDKGRAGWALGSSAADELYTSYRNGQIAETKAVAIAEAAPKNSDLQRVGMEYAAQNKRATAEEIRQYINAVQSMSGPAPTAETLDMFGQSDSALNDARAIAKTAVKLKNDLISQRQVLKSARTVSKLTGDKAAVLAQYGVKPGDIEAINAKLDELAGEIDSWDRWQTDPAKVAQVREQAGLAPAEIREMIEDGDTDLINRDEAEALGFRKRGNTYEEAPSPATEAPAKVGDKVPRNDIDDDGYNDPAPSQKFLDTLPEGTQIVSFSGDVYQKDSEGVWYHRPDVDRDGNSKIRMLAGTGSNLGRSTILRVGYEEQVSVAEAPSPTAKAGNGMKPPRKQLADQMVEAGLMRSEDRDKSQYVYTIRDALANNRWMSSADLAAKTKASQNIVLDTIRKFNQLGLIDTLFRKNAKEVYAWKGAQPIEGLMTEEALDQYLQARNDAAPPPGALPAREDPPEGALPKLTPEEWAAQRGVGPKPKTGEMFGEGSVGDSFTLRQDDVQQGETFAEKQQREAQEAEAAAAQGEMFAGRGEAKVPPGPAQGVGTVPRPDWVLQKAESPTGRSLLKKIAGAKDGQKVGVRSIVDFVNDAVGVEMRRSSSQTSKRHPAHYRPAGHVAFTRNSMSQINFHEAGHGLKELVEARSPKWFASFEKELLALTKAGGSMASANNIHEGVAEWLRLRVIDPSAVDQLRVTPALDQLLAEKFPGLDGKLRDASRAMHAFYEKPADVRWSMFANAPRRATVSGLVDSLVRGSDALSDFFSSGAPLSRQDRKLFRTIMKERAEAGLSLRAALREARRVRGKTQGLLDSHNLVLQIGSETQMAITGKGPLRGLRVYDADGALQRVFPKTWQEIVRGVPPAKWQQFQEAGWAREALNRFEKDRLEYPGLRDGVRPEDLQAIVDKAVRDIPDFQKHAEEVQAFFDAVLDVKDLGGLKAEGEVERMRRRGDYWPLPRVMESTAHTVRRRGHISAGDFRARGSGEAIKGLSEVAEERVRDAMTAYYWNQMGLKMSRDLMAVARDPKLPMEARAVAGRVLQPLKMQRAVAATVSQEEAIGWILADLNAMKAAELGRPLTKEERIAAEDVNLSWDFKDVWRPTAPKDYHVISILEKGERKFFQVQDPSMFNLFASPDQASKAAQAVQWALGPSLQNWKRGITQSLPFAVNNLMGDLFNQVMLNNDAIGWFPGGATMLGVINRFTKKYPQAFQEGLLLARVEPSSVELMNQVKHNAIWQFLTEGFYVSQAKDPAARFLLTALQPSNLLFPIWKMADLVNLVTGGRAVAPFFEGATREGAAVFKKMTGGTDAEANRAYWRVTGTFNEHASMPDFRVAMSMPGFFNPMIQAVRGAGQNLTDPDPAVSGSAWAKLLVLIPALFGGAAYLRFKTMSEEEKEEERQRTITDRASYHDIAGMRIRFPYGPEGAAASLVYNAVMDDLLGRTPADAKVATRNALNRIAGLGSPLEFLGPQIKSATEAKMNWSTFRQQHIVAPWMTGLPASEQFYSTTPEFYKKLGRWADLSPAKIQYFVQNGLNNQVDEAIRVLDNLEQNKPVSENAELPFVGRMFIRDPMGFASASVRSLGDIEQKIKLLDNRINSAGYGYLKKVAGETPAARALQVQLDEVQQLRDGIANLQRLMRISKFQSAAQNWTEEENTRKMMTMYAQSVLSANPEAAGRIEAAISMLEELPERSPQEKALDYGVRAVR
jgi:hypothetical protein